MFFVKQDAAIRTWITSDQGYLSHSRRSSLKFNLLNEFKELGIRAWVKWSYTGKYFTIKFMSEADEAFFTLRYNDRIISRC